MLLKSMISLVSARHALCDARSHKNMFLPVYAAVRLFSGALIGTWLPPMDAIFIGKMLFDSAERAVFMFVRLFPFHYFDFAVSPAASRCRFQLRG